MVKKPHMPTNRRVLLLLGVYYSDLHEGIARYAREAHWELNIHYNKAGSPPVWWSGDGIIGLITNPKDYEALRLYPKLPLVDLSKGWITNAMPPHLRRTGKSVPRVLYDNVSIARLAADHFIRRGYKHMAFLNTGNYWMETEQRDELLRLTQQANVVFHEIPYYGHFSHHTPHPAQTARSAFRWLCRAIDELPKPIGLFAGGDDTSLQVLSACEHMSLRVPDDVAILGYGNEPLICDNAAVPLSSVDIDLVSQGYEAARLLDRLMSGEAPPSAPILIPPKGVVTRMSTNILAVPNPKVARALHFIWEHYAKPIQVRDVVAESGLSRRHLEKAFVHHLKRSIGEEIMSRRIDQARHLLMTSQLKTLEVATASGFSGILHLSRAFKRSTGMRPSEFRKATMAGILPQNVQ